MVHYKIYNEQSQVLVLGLHKKRLIKYEQRYQEFWLEEEIMRLVKSNELERGVKQN